MRIVIHGAGAVGRHLAKLFSQEKHHVTVIDEDPSVLSIIGGTLDVLPIESNLLSPEDFREAKIDTADLFIAVTPSENKNITTSALAKRVGAKKSIARVSSSKYVNSESEQKFRELGIDQIVCPEVIATREIVEALEHPNINHSYYLPKGEVQLVGLRINAHCPVVNKHLKDLDDLSGLGHIVAIIREGDTIIPDGNDQLLEKDIAYIAIHKKSIKKVQEWLGFSNFRIKNIIIIGGTPIGILTASALSSKYHVKLIEQDKKECERIAEILDDTIVVHGDFRDMDLLKEENLEDFDAVVAVTANSESNILFSLLSKKMGAKKTVAEVESIDFINLAHTLEINSVIIKKNSAVSEIFGHTMNADWLSFKTVAWTEADVVEFVVKGKSKISQQPIKNVKFPNDACIAAIIRDNRHIIPRGEVAVMPDDIVVVFSKMNALRKVENLFK